MKDTEDRRSGKSEKYHTNVETSSGAGWGSGGGWLWLFLGKLLGVFFTSLFFLKPWRNSRFGIYFTRSVNAGGELT